MAEMRATLDGFSGVADRFAGADDIPARETRPAFDVIVEDAADNVWVRHYRADGERGRTWSVFDAAGAWLGEVDLPPDVSVLSIGRDELLVSTRDEWGVSYLHVYPLLR